MTLPKRGLIIGVFIFSWDNQPTSPHLGVSDNYKAVEWTGLRANTLMDYYTVAPLSMQCNQSSGDRFPGDWEGLQPVSVPAPLTSLPSHGCGDEEEADLSKEVVLE